MAMYGIAILPLIQLVRHENVTHKWYADDGNAVGKLEDLAAVFQRLKSHQACQKTLGARKNLPVESLPRLRQRSPD